MVVSERRRRIATLRRCLATNAEGNGRVTGDTLVDNSFAALRAQPVDSRSDSLQRIVEAVKPPAKRLAVAVLDVADLIDRSVVRFLGVLIRITSGECIDGDGSNYFAPLGKQP